MGTTLSSAPGHHSNWAHKCSPSPLLEPAGTGMHFPTDARQRVVGFAQQPWQGPQKQKTLAGRANEALGKAVEKETQ